MLKKELRIKYKELRQHLSIEAIEEKSLAIANQLLKLDIWNNTYFHIFLHFETTSMKHFLLTDNTKIKKNNYNIPEPVNGLTVPTEMIDVVFVPLLAYDKQGNRVGYGKGFYDKFLSECKPNVIKIGLSFFMPEELIEDVYENDIRLNFCVNSEDIISFT